MDKLTIVSPIACWRAWINSIVNDEEMSTDRVLRHLQLHVRQHVPDADAPKERWLEWLGGTYNLLAILCASVGVEPSYDMGISLLLGKFNDDPTNHTPPPLSLAEIASMLPEDVTIQDMRGSS
jgi:hypothetical protein